MVDIAVRFRTEAVFGDVLRIQLATVDWSTVGFDLVYLATQAATGVEVARARTGLVFYDYTNRRLTSMPAVFLDKLG
jgi:acyl-CoA thioesterase FadM